MGNGKKWELGLVYQGPLYNTKKFGSYHAKLKELTVLNWESSMIKSLFYKNYFGCYDRFGKKEEEIEKEKGQSKWELEEPSGITCKMS